MALDELALEELGLAPRWVSRGAQASTGAEAALAVEAREAGAPDAPSEAALSHVEAESATAAPVARPLAHAQSDDLPAPAEEAFASPSAGGASGARAALPDPAERPAAPPAEARASRTPPAPDEPPPLAEDDFAWFDAVSSAPAEAAHIAAVPLEPSNDVATLDWDALAERVAGCTRCRLCEKRTNTVFGVGDREADWMVIGEAPGENEDRQGEPFVGQAGKLLDNMLRALTLSRVENVYIANVLKCRPPGNRNPEPDEVARCEPYLKRQVALVKPKIIVAMGRFAAQSVLKSEGSIASMRGRVHEYEGVPVIVTYHPAYLLRSLQDKSKAWADLCLARDTLRAAGGGQ
ncbi:uracil-DNA glycosylase [Paraburkholderia sp. J12]|uniref:uracil-DNA glycosylase n=1 Tax=Paraburkholderia sp. J12 TaxID=2805432 RepID=UPI002ABD59FE|nr:uracil-DNA glycosylase [Paraburkholderia sp. J12]